MDEGQLKQVEALCETFYVGQDAAAQNMAHQTLMSWSASAAFIPQCQHILDQSTSQYALFFSATALTTLITDHWNNFTIPQRLDVRNYLLNYLARKGTALEQFVVVALIKLLCRITKLGWFDEGSEMQNLVEETTHFLQESPQHSVIGLRILVDLVSEMNHQTNRRTLTSHRRIAVAFRDLSLQRAFEIALTVMNQVLIGATTADDATEEQILAYATQLASGALNFDFIGTNPDESSDEVGTIQVPLKWRPLIENPATMSTMFDLYAACATGTVPVHAEVAGVAPPRAGMPIRLRCAAELLDCLTSFISVRRSIFSRDDTRKNFLVQLVASICDIMRFKIGLADTECFHQFCRLLGKLKTNFQLTDLVRTPGYQAWVELAATFAVDSFTQMHVVTNSIHYVLGLWSRLLGAAPHLSAETKLDRPAMLESLAPEVAAAYLEARLNMVEPALQGKIEEPLEDEGEYTAQLEQLPVIARADYMALSKRVTTIMDPLLQRWNELINLMNTRGPDETLMMHLQIIERKLAWVVFFIGAVVGGQFFGYSLGSASKPGEELIDADLSRRVLQLMQTVDMRLASTQGAARSDPYLEHAILFFIQEFRKAFIGEQHGMPVPSRDGESVPVTSKQRVFQALFERMGLGDHKVVVSMMIQKLANNLRFWSSEEPLIRATLALLSELAFTYSTVKLLLTLDSVQHILAHHTAEHFAFLRRPENSKLRTSFYTALSRLLFMDDGNDGFEAFIAPILANLAQIQANLHVRSAPMMHAIIGVCRDLRGIAAATSCRRTYLLLFDALYPAYFDFFAQVMNVWFDQPAVTTVVLKFMGEMVHNKVDRIVFGPMSANGILLFRETSKIVCAYAHHMTNVVPPTEPYANKYKAVALCLRMLSLCFTGNYVNFGVFELYSDPCLDDSVNAALKLVMSVPMDQLLMHPKLSSAFFEFLDVLMRSYLSPIVRLDTPSFLGIINAIKEGLDNVDPAISLNCSACIDNLAGYVVKNIRKETPIMMAIRTHFSVEPSIFAMFTQLLFNILVFGEQGHSNNTNHWALARPLLSLIVASELIRPKSFEDFKTSFIQSQPVETHAQLLAAFDELMKDVTPTVDLRNRERFTQHLHNFRGAVKNIVTIPMA